ncbi:MAG: hypothetical protein B7733_08115 [Myxococcales bacterium FL481]|nr:MAG: hypothetical protein B7733_08115 [Myxococcales bacterium FL481]
MRALYTLLACSSLLGLVACGDDDADDNHGYVTMTFQRLAGEDNPLPGTRRVNIAVDYRSELADFYRDQGNEWAADGPKGAEVFEAWESRLCNKDLPQVAGCTVLSINQELDGGSPQLRVSYEVTDDDIEFAKFYIGPIPTQSLLGADPLVEMNTQGVAGFNGSGDVIWVAKNYEPSAASPKFSVGFSVEVGPQ